MNEVNTYKEQVSDFVEAAAHDLHAPLRKLSILIDRVFTKNADKFNDDAKEYLKRIDTCIEEMRSLIDGLSELAKADSQIASSSESELNLVVEQTLDMMSEEIKEKQAAIEVNPLPVVKGNPVQFKQVFKNLFENAIKFSSKDKVIKICVTSGTLSEKDKELFHLPVEKKYYRIEISDNGIGFNPAYAEKIFEPFVRLHSKSEYDGSGLGLSICKKIITAYNGIIYAEGTEDEGSRFIIILPENS